jgi:hypothetical protein
MQETDYAWLAGIIDGEGSLFVSRVIVPANRRGFSYRTQLSVTNTNQELILKIREIIGSGSVSHIPEPRSDWKDRYVYSAFSGTIRTIVPKILPYLIAKKKHAMKVLELLTLYSQGKKDADFDHVERLYAEIKTLNAKGKLVSVIPKEVN